MNNYTVSELVSCLSRISFEIKGEIAHKTIEQLSTPSEATKTSLIWISPTRENKEALLKKSLAEVIVCDASIDITLFPQKCFILTQNPKLAFLRIGNTFFKKPIVPSIHPTAIIHPEAKIANDVYIGPYTVIGKCEIGEGSSIHENCCLYDHTILKDNVLIQAGCKIGAEGLGHIVNEMGDLENFPQVGGVVLEEKVEIGTNSIVLRGALANTQVKRCAKIDCHVIVGHNVVVGENTIVAANAVLGGSSYIGNQVFIGIGATIIDYMHIEDEAHIGAGSIILENIPAGAKVVARPSIILPKES